MNTGCTYTHTHKRMRAVCDVMCPDLVREWCGAIEAARAAAANVCQCVSVSLGQ